MPGYPEYSVVFSDTADSDLMDIVVYLSNFSPNIARRYYDEIMVRAYSLSSMPQRCPLVQDIALHKKGYRWFFVRNYTIFFVIDEPNKIVDIRAILYSRREYIALL
jgi:plasmid stabilization system protein ParE